MVLPICGPTSTLDGVVTACDTVPLGTAKHNEDQPDIPTLITEVQRVGAAPADIA